MDTSIGKIGINIRGNNGSEGNQQSPQGGMSPAQRRRLQGESNTFFNI